MWGRWSAATGETVQVREQAEMLSVAGTLWSLLPTLLLNRIASYSQRVQSGSGTFLGQSVAGLSLVDF